MQLYSRATILEARAAEIETEIEDRVLATSVEFRQCVRDELNQQILENRKLAEENREAAEHWEELIETFILKMRTKV